MTGNRQRRADLKTRLRCMPDEDVRDVLDSVIDADDEDFLDLIDNLIGEANPNDPGGAHPCAGWCR